MCASDVRLLPGSSYYTPRLSTSDSYPALTHILPPNLQTQVKGKDKELMEKVAGLDEEETKKVRWVGKSVVDRSSCRTYTNTPSY